VPYINSKWLVFLLLLFNVYVCTQLILNRKPDPTRELPNWLGLSSAGTVIGSVSSLVSIGGGSFTTPFLLWHNVDLRRAIATSAAIGVPISLAGSIGYAINGIELALPTAHTYGFVYLPAVITISVVTFFCAPIGARLTHTLPVETVRKLFALLLFLLGLNLLRTIFL
jgi:uncharacterized membrane protein YfcA